ncbi:MAG TPA: ABC transporter ATP-binding protein [Candidatus Xenobia bacterium]|jgi:oligopeptide/dipeptide ABC transporter ATP-binding protein
MNVLEVDNLARHFGAVRAVDGVSLSIAARETVGLVGESGCGKSTFARMVMRLARPTAGTVRIDGQDVWQLEGKALRDVRRHFQMVFQDPMASLNPRLKLGAVLQEPLSLHGLPGTPAELLHQVGLPTEFVDRYPHQLSGGQRQRVGLARALATGPRLVVADEPVSALDVSVQAQIVNLLQDLQTERGLSYLFISHDLHVVRHLSSRVAVMYLGAWMELGPVSLVDRPLHPYTQALVEARPKPGTATPSLKGDPPNAAAMPSGCRFHPRCPRRIERCSQEAPAWREVEPGHWVSCHLA